MRLDSLESALDFLHGIAQHHRSPVRATHRAIRLGEFAEQPFHLGLIERHIYLDGCMARGGSGDFRLQCFNGNGRVFAFNAVENFRQQFFGVAGHDSGRNGLNGKALGPMGSTSKPLADKFLGNFFVNHDLARRQLYHHGHQHALRFDFACAARFEVLFKKHAFVRYVLVDNPQALAIHRDDETGADLAERF